MSEFVRICSASEVPAEGYVGEFSLKGRPLCVANVNGEFSALNNVCPHRQGPLGQGWLEGAAVVCPWHSWTFDVKTGLAEYPVHARVNVYPLRVEGDDVLVEIEAGGDAGNQARNMLTENM